MEAELMVTHQNAIAELQRQYDLRLASIKKQFDLKLEELTTLNNELQQKLEKGLANPSPSPLSSFVAITSHPHLA